MNGAPHVVFNENFDAKVENKNPPTYFFSYSKPPFPKQRFRK